jgi:nucleotide-binding universal stress UspA family protein
MGTIVVGVDGSENSVVAVRWALQEAVARKDTVHVVTCWSPPVMAYPFAPIPDLLSPAQLEEQAREVQQRVIAAAKGGEFSDVTITTAVMEGSASRNLLDAAKDADLLVVGTRGLGGFAGLLMGSVSHQVVHHAPCPVVIVPMPS